MKRVVFFGCSSVVLIRNVETGHHANEDLQ
jgi:hypothetical protein